MRRGAAALATALAVGVASGATGASGTTGRSAAPASGALVGPPAPRALAVPLRRAAPLAPSEAVWLEPWLAGPHHAPGPGFAFGGDAELRFHYDRVEGTADPDWLNVGRASGFLAAHVAGRFGLVGEAAYDRTTQKLEVERAATDVRLSRRMLGQAGILLLPLGASNMRHEAPANDFADRSLVATELLGVPASQIGFGVRGLRGGGTGRPLAYELDLVTGYSGDIVTGATDGTRLSAGRNNYGDNAGAFQLAGRVAWPGPGGKESGVSAQVGGYRMKAPDGTPIDGARGVAVLEADAARRILGLDASGEAGFVAVDVPKGLEGLFAQTQWGASLTLHRVLREPLFRGWESSSLAGSVRAETVDFDRAVAGDSKQRVSATLALRQKPWSVVRWGWYYEWRRDRFSNLIPAAGVALSAATYF